MKNFDAIVVGGGHAGIEAMRSLSARGLKTALVTMDAKKIGAMSCNPAIGGVAKSHMVFEVDALGGWMGFAADSTAIQSRRLNMRKGPAVRSTRVQCDKLRYASLMVERAKSQENLQIIESELKRILFAETPSGKQIVEGVELADASKIYSKVVIVTAGTFMQAIMFCGQDKKVGGRFGDKAADGLSSSFLEAGHSLKRLKTGTPPRLKASSIDFSILERQWGDPEQRRFSWKEPAQRLPQISCFMTYTNERTHDIIRANFDQSPLFSGEIVGDGPRYCPSIEDKVKRFADRDKHQIFLEPEGLDLDTIYPNGMSTCLPQNVQLEYMRSIVGLEKVELARPGYAVEYDSMNPTELTPALMSKYVEGLFFAGQVNRTSGYEEAAAQGLWAGINAGNFVLDLDFEAPDRTRSYMETLVDDLVTKGTEEPYRMFTSRSEYRLLLREDNAYERMSSLGSRLGLVSEEHKKSYELKAAEVSALKAKMLESRIKVTKDKAPSLFEYLKRPEVCWEDLAPRLGDGSKEPTDYAIEAIEIDAKYSGYLCRIEAEVSNLRSGLSVRIPPTFDFQNVPSLSNEAKDKMNQQKPQTIGDLSKLSGITPSAVLAVLKALE